MQTILIVIFSLAFMKLETELIVGYMHLKIDTALQRC